MIKQLKNCEKGSTLLEFAVAFPIVLMFLLIIIFFGFYMNTQIAANNAVREAARTKAIGKDTEIVAEITAERLNSYGVIMEKDIEKISDGWWQLSKEPEIELLVTPITPEEGQNVQGVYGEITYGKIPMFGIPGVEMQDSYVITSEAIYVREGDDYER